MLEAILQSETNSVRGQAMPAVVTFPRKVVWPGVANGYGHVAKTTPQVTDFIEKRRLAGGPGLSATVGNAKRGRKAQKLPGFNMLPDGQKSAVMGPVVTPVGRKVKAS